MKKAWVFASIAAALAMCGMSGRAEAGDPMDRPSEGAAKHADGKGAGETSQSAVSVENGKRFEMTRRITAGGKALPGYEAYIDGEWLKAGKRAGKLKIVRVGAKELKLDGGAKVKLGDLLPQDEEVLP